MSSESQEKKVALVDLTEEEEPQQKKPNPTAVAIKLTNSSQVSWVDAEDADMVNQLSWFLNKDGFAQSDVDIGNGKIKKVLLHNLIYAMMEDQKRTQAKKTKKRVHCFFKQTKRN